MMPACSWGTCDRPSKSTKGGLCGMHIERQRTGSPAMDAPTRVVKTAPIEARYEVAEGGCWVWKMATSGGYGRMTINGTRIQAHRAVWELHRGPVPDGLVLDHLCRNRACVNPDHLEVVTVATNNHRGEHPNYVAMRADECTQGHPFTEANTWREANGSRACKTCHADRERRRRARTREAS